MRTNNYFKMLKILPTKDNSLFINYKSVRILKFVLKNIIRFILIALYLICSLAFIYYGSPVTVIILYIFFLIWTLELTTGKTILLNGINDIIYHIWDWDMLYPNNVAEGITGFILTVIERIYVFLSLCLYKITPKLIKKNLYTRILNSSNSYNRWVALRELSKIVDERIANILKERVENYKERDPYVQLWTILILYKYGEENTVDHLISLLSCGDYEISNSIFEILEMLNVNEDAMTRAYLNALKSNNIKISLFAANEIGKSGNNNIEGIDLLKKIISRNFEEICENPLTVQEWVYETTHRYTIVDIPNPKLDILKGNLGSYMRVLNKLEYINFKTKSILKVPNMELVQEALKNKKIPIEKINDDRLVYFFKFLEEHNLDDKIVVIGGGVRDSLLGKKLNDIDISVKMTLTEEERNCFIHNTSPVNERVFNRALLILKELVKALGVEINDLLNPFYSSKKAYFKGLEVQYAGPIMASSSSGKRVFRKRTIADSKTGELFTEPGPTLLFLAIDSKGELYGDFSALWNLIEGKVSISGTEKILVLSDIIRCMRLKYEYNLEIDAEYSHLIQQVIISYKKNRTPIKTVIINVCETQIEKIREHAPNYFNAAYKEMEELGIIEILEKAKKEAKRDESD